MVLLSLLLLDQSSFLTFLSPVLVRQGLWKLPGGLVDQFEGAVCLHARMHLSLSWVVCVCVNVWSRTCVTCLCVCVCVIFCLRTLSFIEVCARTSSPPYSRRVISSGFLNAHYPSHLLQRISGIREGVVREVKEETGIESEYVCLSSFHEFHSSQVSSSSEV